MKLENTQEAIGYKIRWHSWDKNSYFIPDYINDHTKELKGVYYEPGKSKSRRDSFTLGKGIKIRSTDRKSDYHYWIMMENLYIPNTYELDDRLFEI